MTHSLEITTKIGCANACHFCPQGKLTSAYKAGERMMSMGTFDKILEATPKSVRIDFSGYVEPYFNRLAGAMLAKAVMQGRDVHLYTTLMGASEYDFDALAAHPPQFIKIHAPDKTGLILDDDEWLHQFRLFLETKLPYQIMAMGSLTPKVSAFVKEHNIPIELPAMLSRGGNLWEPKKITGPVRCGARRWHQNVILPDGRVFGCCMDYGLTLPLGNLLTESYDALSARADSYDADHNPPQDSICRTCEWAQAL